MSPARPSDPRKWFSERLSELLRRDVCSVTQDRIASGATKWLDQAGIPRCQVSTSSLSDWKRGKSLPDNETQLLAVLKVALPELRAGLKLDCSTLRL